MLVDHLKINFMEVPQMALNDTKVLGSEVEEVVAAEEVSQETQAQAEVEVVENFDPSTLGIDSDKWAYVAAITDESVTDKNTIKDPKTGKEREIVTGKIIGYVFKALEAGLEYPRTQINSYYRNNMFRFSGAVETKVAKKGEEVQFTVAEILGLASDPRINGVFNGGKFPVTASFTIPANGVNLKLEEDELPVKGFIRPGKGVVSLKELELRVAITSERKPNPKNPKFPIVERKISKGFERFATAIEEKPTRPTAPTGSNQDTYKVSRNAKAAAFAKAFNSRRA